MGYNDLNPIAQALFKKSKPKMMVLEQRMLFDGAAVATTEVVDQQTTTEPAPSTETTDPAASQTTTDTTASADPQASADPSATDPTVSDPATTDTTDPAATDKQELQAAADVQAPDQLDLLSTELLSADALALLQSAVAEVETTLTDLSTRTDYAAILTDAFRHADTTDEAFAAEVGDLTQALTTQGLNLEIEVRSAEELNGAAAAYAAVGHTGTERIYVNADWLNSGISADLLKQVLLEESGHAIDYRINNGIDTTGDEGELFAALITGSTLTDAERAQIAADDDSATLTIEGTSVVVERSITGGLTGSVTEDLNVGTGANAGNLISTGTVTVGVAGEAVRIQSGSSPTITSVSTGVTGFSLNQVLGSVSMNTSNVWTYSVGNSLLNSLSQGQSMTVSFVVESYTTSGTGQNRVITVTDTKTVQITVNGANDAPTFTAFSAVVDTVNEDTQVEITFSELTTKGNATDVDGTVDAFVVKSVTSGTLLIGTSAATATVWVSGANDVIDATRNAYWKPAIDANGTLNAFTVAARDNLGAESVTAAVQAQIGVTAVNDAPTGADKTITTSEDTSYTFSAADFGFSDVDTGDALSAVRIDSVPSAGTLKLSGVAVTAGAVVSAANIGNLTFEPVSNANGAGYATFTFSVRDQSSAYDATPNTITVNVTAVNDAPTGADKTVTTAEDTAYTFAAADFGFSDVDSGDTLSAVRIDTLPTAGTLLLSGSAVRARDVILLADIGNLTFTPAANANGTGYATFTFSVRDQSSAFDTTPNTITVNVSAINDAPVIEAPISITVVREVVSPITGIVLSDVDALESSVLTARFSVPENSGGLAAVSGNNVTVIIGSETNVITLQGTLSALNTFLSNGQLTYTANLDSLSNVQLTLTLNDGGATGADPGLTGGANSEEGSETVTFELITANLASSDAVVMTGVPKVGSSLELSLMDGTKYRNVAIQWQVFDSSQNGWRTISGANSTSFNLDETYAEKEIRAVLSLESGGGRNKTVITSVTGSAFIYTDAEDAVNAIFGEKQQISALGQNIPWYQTLGSNLDETSNVVVEFESAWLGTIKIPGNVTQSPSFKVINPEDYGFTWANGSDPGSVPTFMPQVFFVQDDGTDQDWMYDQDVGNNVAGTLYLVDQEGGSYYAFTGVISRLYKLTGNDVQAFYFLQSQSDVQEGATQAAFLMDLFGGTTQYYSEDGSNEYHTSSENVIRDLNDLRLSVNSVRVNEGSEWAVFSVTGIAGESVLLSLADGTAKIGDALDYGLDFEYYDEAQGEWFDVDPQQGIQFPRVTGNTLDKATLFVRVKINDDAPSIYEGPETFTLSASYVGKAASRSTGIGTIFDDGTGTIFTGDIEDGAPGVDDETEKDNDQLLTIDNIIVNEASPWAVFKIQSANPEVSLVGTALALRLEQTGATSGHATLGTDTGSFATNVELQIYQRDPSTGVSSWVNYVAGTTYTVLGNILIVRAKIQNDGPVSGGIYEGPETFQLWADIKDGSSTTGSAVGTATIVDDGSGDIFNESGGIKYRTGSNSVDWDDDRNDIKVNNVDVNEGSAFAVFTVRAKYDDVVKLSLTDITAIGGVVGGTPPDDGSLDYGSGIEYYSAGAWVTYNRTNGITFPTKPGGSDGEYTEIYVRLKIVNDIPYEGPQSFRLTATVVGEPTRTSSGIGTIWDDGTGSYWIGDARDPANQEDLEDEGITLNDDSDLDGISPDVEKRLSDLVAAIPGSGALPGDLNGDGIQDAEQPALATLAWITNEEFVSALDGTLSVIRPIITLAVTSSDGETVNTNYQLQNISVLPTTGSEADGNITGGRPTSAGDLTVSTNWDPIQFTVAPALPGGLLDIDGDIDGTQVIVVINISRSGVTTSDFNAYYKFVSQAAIDADGALFDLDGNEITEAGWYDFTAKLASDGITRIENRSGNKDGARFIVDTSGKILAIELVITDNAFGDNDPLDNVVRDPGVPVKIVAPVYVIDEDPVVRPPTPEPPRNQDDIPRFTRPFDPRPIPHWPQIEDALGRPGSDFNFTIPRYEYAGQFAMKGQFIQTNFVDTLLNVPDLATMKAGFEPGLIQDAQDRGVESKFAEVASVDAGDALRATKTPPDIRPAEGGRVDYTLPQGTFLGGTGPLNLVATQVDGRALPNWLTFDAAKGVFKGVAPADVRGTIEIRVIARDTNGQKAEVVVKLRVGADSQVVMMEKNGIVGKKSLTDQILDAIEKMKAAA